MSKRIQSCQKRLADCEDEESDMEFVDSVKSQLKLWENKQEFYNHLLSMNLLPMDVRGDGDCAIWSVCALEGGPWIQSTLTTQERIATKRQDIIST